MVLPLMMVLAAAPLTVRVLEREHPVRARVEAKRLTCDGRPLRAPAELEVSVREVRAGSMLCNEVIAAGDPAVTVGDLTRRYAGTMHVVLEGGFLRFIDEVEVEDYLPSVVGGEMGDAAPAALEAQAIVSRTFALAVGARHERGHYQLCDLAHCQLYRGRGDESAAARAAVQKTRGQVVLVGGMVLQPTFFHSSCGGHTSRAQDVFKEDGAGPGVSDVEKGLALCGEAPDFAWEWSIDRMELASGLGLNGRADVAAFEPLRRDAGGRVVELRSFGKRFAGNEFMATMGRTFGWQALRSLKVTASQADQVVTFRGTGLGHGVGLCQQGTRALAARGADAKAILLRYFPDAQVRATPGQPAPE